MTSESVATASTCIRRKTRLDHYGVSVAAIMMLSKARPLAVSAFLQVAVGSTRIMSSISIRGRVLGKESSVSPASGLNAFIPAFCDEHLVTNLQRNGECFVGARPKTVSGYRPWPAINY